MEELNGCVPSTASMIPVSGKLRAASTANLTQLHLQVELEYTEWDAVQARIMFTAGIGPLIWQI